MPCVGFLVLFNAESLLLYTFILGLMGLSGLASWALGKEYLKVQRKLRK